METLGQYAYQAIDKHFHKAIRQEAAALNQEPEALHQMRVGLRRLRSALAVFAPVLMLPKTANAKQARDIAAVLGQVRDLDVLEETLVQEYEPELPGVEQQQLTSLLGQLQHDRQGEFKHVQRLLESGTYKRFKLGFQTWLAKPEYHPPAALAIDVAVADLMLPLVSQLLLHPAWLVGDQLDADLQPMTRNVPGLAPFAPTTLTTLVHIQQPELLHELRKQVKRVRYQAELFAPLYGPGFQAQIQNWASLQELLGKIHDDAVLGTLLDRGWKNDQPRQKQGKHKQPKHKQIGHQPFDPLPVLQQLRWTRQQQYLQTWQQIRQQYLDPTHRQSLRQLMLLPT